MCTFFISPFDSSLNLNVSTYREHDFFFFKIHLVSSVVAFPFNVTYWYSWPTIPRNAPVFGCSQSGHGCERVSLSNQVIGIKYSGIFNVACSRPSHLHREKQKVDSRIYVKERTCYMGVRERDRVRVRQLSMNRMDELISFLSFVTENF